MGEAIDKANLEAKGALKKIKASGGKLQGNFYYAGTGKGTSAGLVVTLLSRDKKGSKALTQGKAVRKEVKGAKFARGTVSIDRGKLLFMVHGGSASANHLKTDFKKSLSTLDGMKLLKAALVRKKGAEVSNESDVVDAEDTSPVEEERLTEDEQRELAELELEQADIADLNEQLTEFLSEDDALKELGEQLSEQLRALDILERATPRSEDDVRDARETLAGLLDIGPDPFPAVGQSLPQDIFHLMALSSELLSDTKASTKSAGEYETLSARIEAQLSTLVALYGAKSETCVTLRSSMGAAQAAVLRTQPPAYADGVVLLKALLNKSTTAVKSGREEYKSQRKRESALESSRLSALKERLQTESELRVLLSSIERVTKSSGGEAIPSVKLLLTAAREHHTTGTEKLTSAPAVALDKLLPLSSGEQTLVSAKSATTQAKSSIKAGTKKVDEARSALKDLLKAVGKDEGASTLLTRIAGLEKKITDQDRIPPDALAPLQETLQGQRIALISLVEGPVRGRPARLVQVGQSLESVEADLAALIERHVTQREGAAEEITRAALAIASLAAAALPEEVIPLETRLQSARAQLEALMIDVVIKEAEAITEAASQQLKLLAPAWESWKQQNIAALQQRVDDQLKYADQLTFPQDPHSLNTSLLSAVSAVTQRSLSYTEGGEQVAEIVKYLDENAAFLSDKLKIGDGLDTCASQVQVATEAATAALSTLREAAASETDDQDVIEALLAPLSVQLAQIGTDWESLRGKLSEDAYIEPVSAILSRLSALKDSADSARGELTKSLEGATHAHAQGRLEAARASGLALLTELRDLGGEDLIARRAALNKQVDEGLTLDDEAMLVKATSIQDDVVQPLQDDVDRLKRAQTQLKEQVATALQSAQSSLAAFKDTVEKHNKGIGGFFRNIGKRKLGDEYALYVTALTTELTQLTPMTDADYPGLLNEARHSLQAFRTEVEEARQGVTEDVGDSGALHSLTALREEILKQVSALDKTVKGTLPAAHKELTDRLKKLDTDLGNELVALSRKSFLSMKAEAVALDAKTRDVQSKRNELSSLAERLEARLKQEPVTDFPSLVADLTSKLQAALKLMKVEGSVNDAEMQMMEIDAAIKRGQSPTALVDMVHDVDTGVRENEEHKVQWEAELDAFNRELYEPFEAAIKASMSLGDRFFAFFKNPKKIAEVKDLKKTADSTAAKGDHQMARYQLSIARSRIQFHLRFPEGQDAAVLADIGRIPGIWRAAVSSLQVQLDATVAAIIEALTDANELDAIPAVSRTAGAIRTLIPTDVFDPVAAGLAQEDAGEKRRWRESGLSEVRRMRELLSDPRIRSLTEHTFPSAPAFSGHFEVGKALLDLEKTILLSADSAS